MLDLAFVMLLTVWAAGVGVWTLHRFAPAPWRALDLLALALPLGFGAMALATLGLAECSALNRQGLAVLGLIGAALGGHAFWQWRATRFAGYGLRTGAACGPRESASARWGAIDLVLAGLLAVTVLGTLLASFAPVTDGDALCYHLQVPKVFLARQRVCFDPDLHETIYPLLTEMLYAVGLAFRGPIACRLTQWVMGMIFALNVTALARPSLGPRAWWAGTIALLVPAVSNGMSAPLNDVALAAFGTAALVAWSRYRDQPDSARVLLAGALAGLALGVKYPALVLTAIVALGIVAGRPHRVSHPLMFGAMAVLVGGAWYLRAALATGNPVFPCFRETFGGAGLDEVLDPIKRPLPVSAWNLLTALAPLTLQPERFDSFSHQFGPVFLLFVPALLVERPPRRLWAITAVGYAFLTVCLTQRQSMRFLLLALGPLSVAGSWLLAAWHERRSLPGRLLAGLFVAALTFQAGLAVVRVRHGLQVVAGRESADEYLARCEPTYRVGQWVATHLPREARIIGQDHRGFYFPRSYTMELAHRRRTGLGQRGESADAVVARLRAEGFTHVLLCPPIPEDAVEFDPTLGRLLASWLDGRTPVYRQDLTDADRVVRRYALYRLEGLEALAQAATADRGHQ